MKKKIGTFDVFNTIIMLGLLVITVYPMLYVISVSFSDSLHIVQSKVTFYPRGFNIDAYKLVLKNPRVPHAYLVTLIYVPLAVFTNLLFSVLGAYPLSKKRLTGKKFFMTMIIITMFFQGGMIPNYIIVSKLNLIDNIAALILPNAVWTFELFILKSFFEAQPPSLYESATIDGASEYRILFQIYVPLSKAALATIGLSFFLGHWNSYFLPMIYINSSEKQPLQVILRGMLIEGEARNISSQESAAMTPEAMKYATIFLSLIPVLVIYPFAQRYFVKGIMLGSVKE